MLLNNNAAAMDFALNLDDTKIGNSKKISALKWLENNQDAKIEQITIPPFGIKTLEIQFQ